jgi:carboxyl-terminal processing protease
MYILKVRDNYEVNASTSPASSSTRIAPSSPHIATSSSLFLAALSSPLLLNHQTKTKAMKTLLKTFFLLIVAHLATAQNTPRELYEQGARWNSTVWQTPYAENISDQEKLAGLALVWSEAKYNFAFFDKVPQLDWDSLYVSYLPKVTQTKSTLEYYQVMQEMAAQLNDGHTGVYPPELGGDMYYRPGFFTALVEDKVIVTEVHDKKLLNLGIRVGTEITHVNGEEIKAHVQRAVRPYVSFSTEHYRIFAQYGFRFLMGKKSTSVELTFLTSTGKKLTHSLAYDWSLLDHLKNKELLEFKMLPNQVAYVSLNSFSDERIKAQFDSIYPQLKSAKALILDVRRNGGGNSGNGWHVIERLTNKNFPLMKWESRNYQATKRAWGDTQSWYGDAYDYKINNPDTADYFHGQVVVLTNPYTFSAAEDFVSAFIQAKRGLVVGEPTGGSTGQPLFFRLPGGGSARICTKRDYFYDGTEWVGKGLQPDVYVAPLLKDVNSGKDTVLEKALEVLQKKTL